MYNFKKSLIYTNNVCVLVNKVKLIAFYIFYIHIIYQYNIKYSKIYLFYTLIFHIQTYSS